MIDLPAGLQDHPFWLVDDLPAQVLQAVAPLEQALTNSQASSQPVCLLYKAGRARQLKSSRIICKLTQRLPACFHFEQYLICSPFAVPVQHFLGGLLTFFSKPRFAQFNL